MRATVMQPTRRTPRQSARRTLPTHRVRYAALALSVVTGVPATYCILAMGVLSIVYTVLGGLEAVIWTDVSQAIVLMGGGIMCLILIAFNVEGGVSGMVSVAWNESKLHTFNWEFSVVKPTFWVIFPFQYLIRM